jgi:hypothetical protein
MTASRMDERRKALYIRHHAYYRPSFVIAGLDPAIQEMPGSSPGMTLFDARSEMDS